MNWNVLIAALPGVVAIITLAYNLIKFIQKAVREKNWDKLLGMIMTLMAEAEQKFSDGATRKEWVMAMALSAAKSINYEINVDDLSRLIDSLCDLTKVVNPPLIKKGTSTTNRVNT